MSSLNGIFFEFQQFYIVLSSNSILLIFIDVLLNLFILNLISTFFITTTFNLLLPNILISLLNWFNEFNLLKSSTSFEYNLSGILTNLFYYNDKLNYTLKFLILISILVFIRGGIPRYRYDFLTKLGWVKFLSWILASFTIFLLYFLVF